MPTGPEAGFITMTIQDNQDGFLLLSVEDTGKMSKLEIVKPSLVKTVPHQTLL
jgi:hypothetical protein